MTPQQPAARGKVLTPGSMEVISVSIVSLDVTERSVDLPPAFRFLFDRSQLAVVPCGFIGGNGLLHELEEPWEGPVGDVFALDDDCAVAHFARVPASLRAEVESELRKWAREDDWELEIAPGAVPLSRIVDWTPVIGSRPAACSRCNAPWPGEEEAIGFAKRCFFLTRCGVCGEGRITPYGLVRCERCHEARGWLIEGFAGEIEDPTASCLCEGVLCTSCGINMVHRPISNYFDEEDRTVWHVPHFSQAVCWECQEAESQAT